MPALASGSSVAVADHDLLLEYLRALEPKRSGRHAVRITAGRLKPLGRRPEHRRSVDQGFAALAETGKGELFALGNGDLLFFYPDEHAPLVDSELDRLRSLFADSLSGEAVAEDGPWFTVFDCGREYQDVVRLATLQAKISSIVAARSQARRPLIEPDVANAPKPDVPLTLETLARLEAALAGADFSSLLRRHTVCRFAQDDLVRPTFTELTVSIGDLARTVVPGLDLTANGWLFDILTETLDRRMLSSLTRSGDLPLMSSISLNLNVETLLGEDFRAFDQAMSAAKRANLVIELKDKDVFHDLESFICIRDLLRRKGYRFCLDGVGWRTLDLIDTERLGFDFVKVNVDQAIDESGEHLEVRLKWLVERVGSHRFILARVEVQQALNFGRDAGVTLFQGHLIERILSSQRRQRL